MSFAYREFTYPSVDGLVLFCREYRPATPQGTVVCLPGLTRNSQDFADLARHLAARYRVLTPDLRGRGRSQWDSRPANYHPVTYYNDVLALLSASVSQPAAVIGTSLGGILAMSLAAMAPERIAGIVLNDVGPQIAREGLARIGSYVGMSPPLASWQEAVQQVQTNYGLAYPDLDATAWEAYARSCYRQCEDGSVVPDYDPAIGDTLRASPPTAFDMWPVWALIRRPVLAIRGASSDILGESTLARMRRDMPSLQSFEVAGRGHVPLLDEPGVHDHIDAFLARIFQ